MITTRVHRPMLIHGSKMVPEAYASFAVVHGSIIPGFSARLTVKETTLAPGTRIAASGSRGRLDRSPKSLQPSEALTRPRRARMVLAARE